MENPATWGPLENAIEDALDWEDAPRVAAEKVCKKVGSVERLDEVLEAIIDWDDDVDAIGGSKVMAIANVLRSKR